MAVHDLLILTGAPGTGKTAILDVVSREIRCVAEPAREVLAEQRADEGTGTPEQDASLFVELLLGRSIEKHRAALSLDGPTLFDRGVPDCIAYAVMLETDPAPSILAAERHRYRRQVLILEPWEEIYATDQERRMAFDGTIEFHEAILRAYELSGYELVPVPKLPIESRVAFVRDLVTRGERAP